jgi:hypothetical protein
VPINEAGSSSCGSVCIGSQPYPIRYAAWRAPAPHRMGLEGIVSKRKGSPYRSGRTLDWLKAKNPNAPAVARLAGEDWGRT